MLMLPVPPPPDPIATAFLAFFLCRCRSTGSVMARTGRFVPCWTELVSRLAVRMPLCARTPPMMVGRVAWVAGAGGACGFFLGEGLVLGELRCGHFLGVVVATPVTLSAWWGVNH